MKSLLAILIGLSVSIAAQAAGFGYDPFAGKSPTSAGGSTSHPSGPASQPVKPAPTAPVSPGAQPVKSKQGPTIPATPAAKN